MEINIVECHKKIEMESQLSFKAMLLSIVGVKGQQCGSENNKIFKTFLDLS